MDADKKYIAIVIHKAPHSERIKRKQIEAERAAGRDPDDGVFMPNADYLELVLVDEATALSLPRISDVLKESTARPLGPRFGSPDISPTQV